MYLRVKFTFPSKMHNNSPQARRVESRLYAANVWTFGYLPRARMENEVGEPLSRPAAWLVAPDLFVSRLDRPTISAAVSDLITHGGLPSNWLVASSE